MVNLANLFFMLSSMDNVIVITEFCFESCGTKFREYKWLFEQYSWLFKAWRLNETEIEFHIFCVDPSILFSVYMDEGMIALTIFKK